MLKRMYFYHSVPFKYLIPGAGKWYQQVKHVPGKKYHIVSQEFGYKNILCML